jgi:hypothetical protein
MGQSIGLIMKPEHAAFFGERCQVSVLEDNTCVPTLNPQTAANKFSEFCSRIDMSRDEKVGPILRRVMDNPAIAKTGYVRFTFNDFEHFADNFLENNLNLCIVQWIEYDTVNAPDANLKAKLDSLAEGDVLMNAIVRRPIRLNLNRNADRPYQYDVDPQFKIFDGLTVVHVISASDQP